MYLIICAHMQRRRNLVGVSSYQYVSSGDQTHINRHQIRHRLISFLLALQLKILLNDTHNHLLVSLSSRGNYAFCFLQVQPQSSAEEKRGRQLKSQNYAQLSVKLTLVF